MLDGVGGRKPQVGVGVRVLKGHLNFTDVDLSEDLSLSVDT